MLHSYAFSNYQSFRDRTEVDLLLNSRVPNRGWEATSKSGARVSTALAIFGANGAGKTSLLKPLSFVDWFLVNSFSWPIDLQIPITPHFTTADEPTEIEFVAEDEGGEVWKYQLRLTRNRVMHEALYKKKTRFSYVFIRDWDEKSSSYSIRQQGFGFSQREAERVRPNASLISTAIQYGVQAAEHIAEILQVSTNIDYFGRRAVKKEDVELASKIYSEVPMIKEVMISILKSWDLGLDGIEIEQKEVPDANGKSIKKWLTFGVHKVGGEDYKLPLEFESSGTQSAYLLLRRLLTAITLGGVVMIDELESDLHPHIVEAVVGMFADPSINPGAAQLIFTCHSTSILDRLQKAQVMFVEKDGCVSEAFRGDEIKGLRSDDNLRSKYETGALGAIPRI